MSTQGVGVGGQKRQNLVNVVCKQHLSVVAPKFSCGKIPAVYAQMAHFGSSLH